MTHFRQPKKDDALPRPNLPPITEQPAVRDVQAKIAEVRQRIKKIESEVAAAEEWHRHNKLASVLATAEALSVLGEESPIDRATIPDREALRRQERALNNAAQILEERETQILESARRDGRRQAEPEYRKLVEARLRTLEAVKATTAACDAFLGEMVRLGYGEGYPLDPLRDAALPHKLEQAIEECRAWLRGPV